MADIDTDFQPILMNTLKLEGGYTVDNGKPTNFGVRQDIYDSFAKANKLQSKSVKELTFGDVKNFYQKEYYSKVKDLPTRNLKGLAFDHAVNAGSGNAIKAIQEIVGTKSDGIIGAKTKKAVEKYIEKNGEEVLQDQLIQKRIDHYSSLVTQDPIKYSQYENGWLNRVNKLLQIYKNPNV